MTDGQTSALLTVLLDQQRVNFRVLAMLLWLADGKSVSHEDMADLAGVVAKMAEGIPALVRELQGEPDGR